jgi:hypothetical protein
MPNSCSWIPDEEFEGGWQPVRLEPIWADKEGTCFFLRSFEVPYGSQAWGMEDVLEWGSKIELHQEGDDAEYLQNYVDPLRDPDRLWNV